MLPSPDAFDSALEKLSKAFKCPKCHGVGGHARRVRLNGAKISSIFHRAPGEYAFVTCTLCGYTEAYDLAVRVRAESEKPVEAKIPAIQQA